MMFLQQPMRSLGENGDAGIDHESVLATMCRNWAALALVLVIENNI